MPWWEKKMWLDCLEEEFNTTDSDDDSGDQEPTVTHTSDSLDTLGIKPRKF